jgi:hypothetical protein
VGKGMVSKYAIDTALTVYNYNNTCANLKSEARERDNLISAYIDDGEEVDHPNTHAFLECELLLDWYRTTFPLESNIN